MLDGDYTATKRCEFCNSVLVAIKITDRGYLVQCEKCGAISEARYAYKNNSKPSRMAKVRKLKKKYYDMEADHENY
jgi:transcription elongation factor Elf1